MKILQVTPRYPPRSGGVETHVQEISERLVERGHDVTVVTADLGPDVQAEETRNGVEVRRFHGLAPGDAYHVAPRIYPAVRDLDADVVHAHNYHALPALFAALAVDDDPFVVTPHYHGESASAFRTRLLSLYRPLGGRALRTADRVVAVSEWERDQIQAHFGVDATVIPNGIDVDRFRKADPVERARPYILCVGRLVEYKDIQDVIRALPLLPDYDLVVAGDGPYRRQLEEAATVAGVTDRVHFEGYVPTADLAGLYAGADAYVSLSRFEAYGMTVGEALAAGTPCVVRDSGALRSWTRYDGVEGIGTTDPDVVVRAIESVAGTDVSVSLPTWNAVTRDLLDCYESVLSS